MCVIVSTCNFGQVVDNTNWKVVETMGRKDEAYQYLKDAILSNKLPPEAPVRELEIAAELKMSRTPIREAMRELEAEGLIVSYPSRGSFVLSLTPYDVEEIYELRVLYELWALEKGFSRITEDELDVAQKAFDDAFTKNDWKANHEADRLLHRIIIEKAGSKRLASFMRTLNAQIERIRFISSAGTGRLDESYQEHSEIIALMRANDLAKCKEALRSHLQTVTNTAIDESRTMEVDLRFGLE